MPVDNDIITEIGNSLAPVAGCEIVHRLTNAEIQAYGEMVLAESDVEDIRALIVHDIGVGMGEAFVRSMENAGSVSVGTPLEAELVNSFLKAHSTWSLQRIKFWHAIRSGRNLWNCYLAVRAGWVVVNLGPKYSTK